METQHLSTKSKIKTLIVESNPKLDSNKKSQTGSNFGVLKDGSCT
jgi:hypothetical protein